jgi:thioredoxin 2
MGAQEAPVIRCPTCGRPNRVPPAARGAPRCGVCGNPLPWLAESGESDFQTVVAASDLPVLVDFWAPWCAPCRIVSPRVEHLAEELRGRIKVVKINTDDNPALANRFGIRGIPTLMILDHGHEVSRVTGALDAGALRRWVDGNLPAPAAPATEARTGQQP